MGQKKDPSRRPRSARRGGSGPVQLHCAPPPFPAFHPDDWAGETLAQQIRVFADHCYPEGSPAKGAILQDAEREWDFWVRYGEPEIRFRTLADVDAWRASRGLPPRTDAAHAAEIAEVLGEARTAVLEAERPHGVLIGPAE